MVYFMIIDTYDYWWLFSLFMIILLKYISVMCINVVASFVYLWLLMIIDYYCGYYLYKWLFMIILWLLIIIYNYKMVIYVYFIKIY